MSNLAPGLALSRSAVPRPTVLTRISAFPPERTPWIEKARGRSGSLPHSPRSMTNCPGRQRASGSQPVRWRMNVCGPRTWFPARVAVKCFIGSSISFAFDVGHALAESVEAGVELAVLVLAGGEGGLAEDLVPLGVEAGAVGLLEGGVFARDGFHLGLDVGRRRSRRGRGVGLGRRLPGARTVRRA